MGQTMNLAPADKKLYALRDTINCTDSIPLIASSIMSKKIAAGANKIVIDVTCGSGAFMKDYESAKKLADIMTKIGKLAGRETVCIITDMNQPVGHAVGNTLEVIEAINILKGKEMPEDIKNIITEFGGTMLVLAEKASTLDEGKEKILENIKNGEGYKKFIELVENQGGDISFIENTDKFEKAKYILPIIVEEDGIIEKLDAGKIGELASFLGAGRIKKEDKINPRVGFILNKKIGDRVKSGEILGFVHADDQQKANYVLDQEIYVIKNC